MSQAQSTTQSGALITVRVMGKAAEFASPTGSGEIPVHLPAHAHTITPLEIIHHVANQNPLLKDQLIREDGTPRSSTKILLNGTPPKSLHQKLSIQKRTVQGVVTDVGQPAAPGSVVQSPQRVVVVIVDIDLVIVEIVIVVVVPCDG